MRLSREVTGWAFVAEVAGVRHAGLAVGPVGVSPFVTGHGAGGSLFARARGWGLAPLRSLDELPFGGPVAPGCRVTQDEAGVLAVRGPGGAPLVHDLLLEQPPGWSAAAAAAGSVLLVVSHVLPATDDPLGALDFETRRGMVCAGPVRFGAPGAPSDDPHEAGEPREEGDPHQADDEPHEGGEPPTVRVVVDPVGILMELALSVCDRIMSLEEAKRRARGVEEARRALAAHHRLSAGELVDLLCLDDLRAHRGGAEFPYVYWRLVAEVAEVGAVPSAWRIAALRTVEAAVRVVEERCDREVFEEAAALAARLVEGAEGAAGLEAALLAAASLRMAVRGPAELAADRYADRLLTTWSARLTAELYRLWSTPAEPFVAESHRLLVEAGHLVVRALELTGGARRPRLLALLAQLLVDEEEVHADALRAAWAAWLDEPEGEPDLGLFLLRTADGIAPEAADRLLVDVFGMPPAAFAAAYGTAVTARVISQGVNLARERADRRLLRAVLSWAGEIDLHWDAAHRRQLTEARLHVLPDDPTECPGPDEAMPVSSPPVFPASWPPARRSAALLHAAAHARDRQQPALGIALLRQAGDDGSEEVRLLTADLYHQAATAGEPGPGPVPFPWGYFTYAALAYATLRFEELARASLVPFVQQLAGLSGDGLRDALYAIIVDVPNFDPRDAVELGAILRDLVHGAHWQLVAQAESQPVGLLLGLHQAGKGSQLGVWWRIEGPLALPVHVQHFLGRLRDLEDQASTEPAPGAEPASLLTAADGDRRPGGQDHAQLARNLRRRISSFIDEELFRRSAPLVDDRRLWADASALLDDRTVLLTWFLPTAVNGAAVLLAVTREGRELVVQLGEGAEDDDERHPLADRIEAIRTEIERDPLFGEVTPEGARLLAEPGLPLGRPELWDRWRARGKDRILAWPHGALHYLPLPLCRTGGRLIVDDWTVTTIAGLEALAPVEVAARERRTVVLASAAGGVPYGLPAEPALEEHARQVAAAVGSAALTGRAATRDRLLAEIATADVVHIAAHGTLDEDAPWLHCLYLSPDGDDDGRLFAYDFLGADLRGVRLVTVAACESALGRFDRGDNVRGIPSALITAGAQAVVGCLWPVRPEPTTYFHHHLHRTVAAGADPEPAFRAAQLATREAYPHYRDWGAFTYLHGRNKGAAP
ncbi:CHAT domain-containing protein [Streptomyces sp. NPDC089919]|uniref:CHAT domain-containing protein n=1 Tax=Streptomyces sp. NPDC089919 TaxID=3155188 RepID=UPI00343A24B9